MGDAYAATLDRINWLRAQDYTVVEIWECQYEHMLRSTPEVLEYVNSIQLVEPLNVRDAFFGGRTCATRLHYKVGEDECIRYYDFVSLYPTINKYGRMPVGHPTIIVDPAPYAPGQYYGFVKCQILPPRDLYIPVLPVRSRNRLLFPLCSKCADTRQDNVCLHYVEERALTGTWITPEVDQAITKGYRVLHTYEIWHFPECAEYRSTSKYPNGLMGGYVNELLKIKQEASGWPADITTVREKEAFLQEFLDLEGKGGLHRYVYHPC